MNETYTTLDVVIIIAKLNKHWRDAVATERNKTERLERAMDRVISLPSALRHDDQQREMICYWPKDDPQAIVRAALAENTVYSRRETRIKELEDAIRLLISAIPEGWAVPLFYSQTVTQVRDILKE